MKFLLNFTVYVSKGLIFFHLNFLYFNICVRKLESWTAILVPDTHHLSEGDLALKREAKLCVFLVWETFFF